MKVNCTECKHWRFSGDEHMRKSYIECKKTLEYEYLDYSDESDFRKSTIKDCLYFEQYDQDEK